ncbi:MAG: hypothetical protein ACJ75B_13360 [Flavisolibacter sp.]
MKQAGIILIVIGFAFLLFAAFQYTSNKKVVDTPVLKITKTEYNNETWALYFGAAFIIGGGAFVLMQKKNR